MIGLKCVGFPTQRYFGTKFLPLYGFLFQDFSGNSFYVLWFRNFCCFCWAIIGRQCYRYRWHDHFWFFFFWITWSCFLYTGNTVENSSNTDQKSGNVDWSRLIERLVRVRLRVLIHLVLIWTTFLIHLKIIGPFQVTYPYFRLYRPLVRQYLALWKLQYIQKDMWLTLLLLSYILVPGIQGPSPVPTGFARWTPAWYHICKAWHC